MDPSRIRAVLIPLILLQAIALYCVLRINPAEPDAPIWLALAKPALLISFLGVLLFLAVAIFKKSASSPRL